MQKEAKHHLKCFQKKRLDNELHGKYKAQFAMINGLNAVGQSEAKSRKAWSMSKKAFTFHTSTRRELLLTNLCNDTLNKPSP